MCKKFDYYPIAFYAARLNEPLGQIVTGHLVVYKIEFKRRMKISENKSSETFCSKKAMFKVPIV